MEGKFYETFIAFMQEKKERYFPPWSRRSFLKKTGMAAFGFLLPSRIWNNRPDPIPPPEGDVTVSIVRKDTIEDMVNTAIELAGGLDEINPGDTVVIKPNITAAADSASDGARIVTSPEVLRAVIRAVKERTGEENITVADACAFGLSTKKAAESTGIYRVCREEGAHFSAWEEEEYVSFKHPHFSNLRGRRKIPASLSSFDHFINVPVLKNHEMVFYSNVSYTCCLKNFVGVISPRNRIDIHTRDLGEKVAELNLCRPHVTMNIVDALSIILTDGPAGSHMKTADAGLIVASKDRVACDSVALAVLRYYASRQGIRKDYVKLSVWEQPQIKRAFQLGLGRTDTDHIIIRYEGVNDINGILEKWC